MIEKAAALLNAGELVAFPTETVYGLGADAGNPEAVKKIFTAKNRPADHPVIVHIAHQAQLAHWVKSIPPAAETLMQHFWPGPMTLIFEAQPHVSALITGGQPTIGIRMPSHPIARALLKAFGGAVAAPSANRFGKISPTTAAHVRDELGEALFVLDGGECVLGIESTIMDVTCVPPRLLRPGPLNSVQIKKISGITVTQPTQNSSRIPRVSGSLLSHYAPATPLKLFRSSTEIPMGSNIAMIRLLSDPVLYAHQLYARLRALDAQHFDAIWVEMPPDTPEWAAVRDRLTRAAA